MSSFATPAPRTLGPRPSDDRLDIFGLTHQGRVRSENQDHFLLCSLNKTMHVMATSLPTPELIEMDGERIATLGMVADGVGGSAAGEAASRATIEIMAGYVTHTLQCYYTGDATQDAQFLDSLQQAANHCHEAVVARVQDQPQLKGMATTLTLLVGVWPRIYLLQVGDSRAYRLRQGALEQLTRDQTMAQDLYDRGVLGSGEVRRSPLAHVLSSAIGSSNASPVVGGYDLEDRDVFLLCTDGLTKHVPDDRIHERLAAMTSAEQVCNDLLHDALEGGGSDNITIIVARVRPDD